MDSSDETRARALTERLDRLHRLFLAEQNPLYAWEALTACRTAGRPPAAIPEWVIEHLVTVGCLLLALGEGRDPTSHPVVEDGETAAAYERRRRSWRDSSEISTDQAKQLVQRVLRLARPGWSAFAAYRSDRAKMNEAARVLANPELLRADDDLRDERNRRRRIARGRRVLAPSERNSQRSD